MGLVLAVRVHVADVQDRGGARLLVEQRVAPNTAPSLRLVWADQGCTGACAEWLREARRWQPEVVRHPAWQEWRYGYENPPRHAFQVLPRRWIVERTLLRRRLCPGQARTPSGSPPRAR
jgi:transposase